MKSVRIGLLSLAMVWGALFANAMGACAHEVRPALLQVNQKANGRYDVLWKHPTMGTLAVHLVPHIGRGTLDIPPSDVQASSSFEVRIWRNIPLSGDLNGQTIRIEGLEQTITDVMVLITMADGRQQQAMLHPASPAMIVDVSRNGIAVWAYLLVGVEHILTGFDHLSFVLGLVLLVGRRAMLVKAVTAFTVAHSLTLGATALGLVAPRPAIVEPLVALSIVFIAVEVVHHYQGRSKLTARFPWLIAFSFGLLHGFAFAGALQEIGLPQNAVLLALLLFNLGVEFGQLLFIAAVLLIGFCLGCLPRPIPRWTRWIPPYAIGSFAVVWLLERTTAALQVPQAF